MNAPVTIKGWCPTALRPMMSGDGLLVRVPAPRRGLIVDQVRSLTTLADTYGNGLIDLTARANLQIRGVRERSWTSLIDGLRESGLLDAYAAGDPPVNIIVPPLASLDCTALFDALALARAIEAGLHADPGFRDLPSKFGFSIDDGGALPPGDTGADIIITAVRAGDDVRVMIGLDGDDVSTVLHDNDLIEVVCAAALRLTRVFLALRNGDERRMRTLIERLGARRVFVAAGLECSEQQVVRRSDIAVHRPLGLNTFAKMPVVGVAAPFGAWRADDFSSLAQQAGDDAMLHVTPWRVLLLTGLSPDHAADILARMAERGLIVAPDDPCLRVSACVGAPACASATVETRALAQELSMVLPHGDNNTSLHVSGCSKGCARPRTSSFTLVGHDGRYDVVIDGSASDTPAIFSLDSAGTLHTVSERLAS